MSTAEVGRRPSGSATIPAKRNWLADVSRTVKKRPNAMIIYGVPGIGKTSLAAQVPGVVFMTDIGEDGINRLKESEIVKSDVPVLPPIGDWTHALDVLEELRNGEHNFRCLAIDAIGGFERLCHDYVCKKDYRGDNSKDGFQSYQAGYETSVGEWRRLIIAMDRLRDERNMSLLLLGHARVAPFKNPTGPDYDRFVVDVHHKTWAVTQKWADMILFANYEVAFAGKDESKAKAKARGGQLRVLHCEHSAAFDAKNRHNLPATIDMGFSGQEAWANLVDALKSKGNS